MLRTRSVIIIVSTMISDYKRLIEKDLLRWSVHILICQINSVDFHEISILCKHQLRTFLPVHINLGVYLIIANKLNSRASTSAPLWF